MTQTLLRPIITSVSFITYVVNGELNHYLLGSKPISYRVIVLRQTTFILEIDKIPS